MLRHGVWAIPASQQHDRDPFKRFGNRGVVLEIAMYYLDTFWRLEWGRVTNKGANLGTGTNKGLQCRASDLARCRSNEYHGPSCHFRTPVGRNRRGLQRWRLQPRSMPARTWRRTNGRSALTWPRRIALSRFTGGTT